MSYDAVVVGGGLSGMAAAVSIAGAGGRVALIEQAPKLGGRCYSYKDPETGDEVDNGQHVLLGSYTHLLKYLDTIGTSHLMTSQRSLELLFHHPDRGFGRFRLGKFPSPLDLASGILTYRLLSPADKMSLLRAGNWLRGWSAARERELAGKSVRTWLQSLGQSRNARDCFWDPISISVMNETPDLASALLFAKTLRAVFLESGADARMLIPTVGQTKLYVEGAVEYLLERKSIIRTKSHGATLLLSGAGRARGVVLTDGEKFESGCVIAALPHWSLSSLIPPGTSANVLVESFRSLTSSPIVSINLWFDRPVMEHVMVGIIGKTIQWAFDRRKIITEERGAHSMISCVVSAAREISSFTPARISEIALTDLISVYPQAADASLMRSVVIKEKRATFSPVPGVERLRPGALTAIGGFYIAGDWTDTGLPATIEGAVKSGFTAAAHARNGD